MIAKKHDHEIEINRDGLRQICFINDKGNMHKKLHEGHLKALYPDILESDARIGILIERVAPGRSCAHRPMREIIEEITGKKTSLN